jgi:hypothetical protein
MGVYQRPYATRGVVFGQLGIVLLVAIGLIVVTVAESQPQMLVFLVFWCGAAGWHTYWKVTRVALRVEIDESELRWWSALRSGCVPIADITWVGPGPGVFRSTAPVLIKHRGGRAVTVVPTRGIIDLVEAIARQRPDLALRLDWWDGHEERWQHLQEPSAWEADG